MVSQPTPPPKLFHPATFFKVRSNFPSRFRFVLKHLHFRAYLPRFVVSMRNAGPSAGENRRSFLQRCTLFGQAALARRVQWTKQRGEAGCAAEAEQGGAAFLRFAALPLTTSFFFPFDRSAGARGPGRGFRLPLPTPSGLPTHPNDQGLNPGPR